MRFWSILAPQPPPRVEMLWGDSGAKIVLVLHLMFVLFWIASKTAQEAPKRPQDPPKSAQRGSKRPPRAPQEAPRGAQDTRGAGQEGSRPSKIAPKGSKRTLSQRRLCISMLQISQRSTKTKTLLTRGAVKKGRAGGGVPPWGRQSAARPGGARSRRVGSARRSR